MPVIPHSSSPSPYKWTSDSYVVVSYSCHSKKARTDFLAFLVLDG